MLSSAGLMNSFATTPYANSTRGCATARMIAEITPTKTQTCAVGWNCHLHGFPLKTIDAYFITHYFSIFHQGILLCHFLRGSLAVIYFFIYLLFFKDTSISFSCLFFSSQTSLPSYEAVPLQKQSRVSAHGPSLQQSGRLRRQLGWGGMWWAQDAPIHDLILNVQ